MRLTGFAAIEYAEKHGLALNKSTDAIDEGRTGLSIAEAEALATEEPELIWLEVDDRAYHKGAPSGYVPDR